MSTLNFTTFFPPFNFRVRCQRWSEKKPIKLWKAFFFFTLFLLLRVMRLMLVALGQHLDRRSYAEGVV